MTFRTLAITALSAAALATATAAPDAALREAVAKKIAAEYPSLEAIYKDLHAHPELSFMETRTAALVARELRALGFEVTEKVGNTGVVAVMKNGPGRTVLLREDMDALPLLEKTSVPYASKAIVKDLAGKDSPAMHACAHDSHVTTLLGTARVLASVKDRWSGTLILVGQPAEEIGAGALAMLTDGLYTRFPVPDYVLGLHVWAGLPAGTVTYVPGPVTANVDSIDILVRGIGGHGSRPHMTKDPVVLASEIVLALQTIVSRELEPGTPAVVTVGTFHGGTKRNIIPDEVKLELTLRSYDDAVAAHLIASIRRIAENLARAAGVPADRLPVVTAAETNTPVCANNPALTQRLAGVWRDWLGEANVRSGQPLTVGEDFARYGRTTHRVPICLWLVGATAPAEVDAAQRTGTVLPGNHSPLFAPVPEPTLKGAITSLSAAALDLLAKP
ncbi:MAG: amidohydrolase [Verrucomicrobia bacterium]|nr:amidohydrolase [Verrucomicrobiota bacterium]